MGKKTIRIGCGQGFWGDWLEAPVNLVRQGPIDYLILDYLAEVTMSILVKQHSRDARAGFAQDFVDLIAKIGPDIAAKGIKVIANAGGINPLGCGAAIRQLLDSQGNSAAVPVAVVTGDNLLPEIDNLLQAGETLENFDDKRPFSSVQPMLRSANAYIGAKEIADALGSGAGIVITGRVADPCLALAPMIHEFAWRIDDWDRLAAGVVAGHVIECGAQCSGGNSSFDWQHIPDLAAIGYPIAEVSEDGGVVITKHTGTGGRVSIETVKEQLVYEIGDPKAYITPDVVADFTSLRVAADGLDRVRISGVKGYPRPEKLKVSCSYFTGFTATGSIVYSWPDAYQKAVAAAEIVRKRLSAISALPQRLHWEAVGADACHGVLAGKPGLDLAEVTLRMSAHDPDRQVIERFTREIAPLVLSGPPGATSYAGGKGEVREMIAYWPTLVKRELVKPSMKIL